MKTEEALKKIVKEKMAQLTEKEKSLVRKAIREAKKKKKKKD
jgi:hypothetical protein